MKKEYVRLIFGLKIRQLRQDKNLSFKQLSESTGLSVSYLNEIEKGKKFPKPDKVFKLAESLGVSYDQLVSLKLSKKLEPIAVLIQSGILDNLPLEVFGLEASTVLELIAEAPSQVNAFISTLIKIARNYELSQENFYFAALRSYQEMHDNYFEDIEASAILFTQKHLAALPQPIDATQLRTLLRERFKVQVSPIPLELFPALKSMRAVLDPEHRMLYLHPELTPGQEVFQLGREIGFQFLGLTNRPFSSPPSRIHHFEEALNNFKASYFAVCLSMPRDLVIEDIKAWFNQPLWDPAYMLGLMQKYEASPEMFLHRLVNLLPKFFNLDQLFFLRFSDDLSKSRDNFSMSKELHLSRLHNPHRNDLDEHYCRRWVSIRILDHLKMDANLSAPRLDIQRSSYVGSKSEYLCISLAHPGGSGTNYNLSVTLGILIDNNSKRKIRFLEDSSIPFRQVSETCERCPIMDCTERVAQPTEIVRRERDFRISQQVELLKQLTNSPQQS